MSANNIKAVLFDLGETLWHLPNMPPVEEVRGETMRRIKRALNGWGHELTEERRFLGRDIRLAVSEQINRAFHGDCVEPDYAGLCRHIAREYGMELTPEQGAELWGAWNLGGAFLRRELFPDVLDTLRWLRDREYRMAAVTNRGYAGPLFQQEVSDLGLAEFMEVVVTSCDLGYMKPHPRIYQYTLEHMGIEAGEAAMVGDDLRADVEGARTLGMTAIWRRPVAGEPVEPTETVPDPEGPLAPDYIVENIGDLVKLPLFAGAKRSK